MFCYCPTNQEWHNVVDDAVYEQTAKTLDSVYNALIQKNNPPDVENQTEAPA